jgi:hypothetical protein
LELIKIIVSKGRDVARRGVYLWVVVVLCSLTACRSSPLFRSGSQEDAFRQQYIGTPFYTAIVLRPYDTGDTYLIDLTGVLYETALETARAALTVPLGSRIRLTGIQGERLVAHIEGYGRAFDILMRTRGGTFAEIAEELKQILSDTPPLQSVRSDMRPFIERQELARGMSRREVYMSWGQPDRVNSAPGSTGFLEEWIYFNRQMHLFLKDGFLTNWERF